MLAAKSLKALKMLYHHQHLRDRGKCKHSLPLHLPNHPSKASSKGGAVRGRGYPNQTEQREGVAVGEKRSVVQSSCHMSLKVVGDRAEALGPFQEVTLGPAPEVPRSTAFVWQHLLQLIMTVTGHKL